MSKNNLILRNIKTNIKTSILLLFFLSFISAAWVEYDYDKQYGDHTTNDAPKTVSYSLNLEDSKNVAYYMKVTVIPREDFETPVLCFSPTDNNCKDDIQAIGRSTNKQPAVLYLRKEQFYADQKELHILVTCVEDRCGYTLKFEGLQSAEIDTRTSYSYLVTSVNKEMRFEVYGENPEKSFLTIGFEGSKSAQITVDGIDIKPYQIDNGKIVTIPLEEENNSTKRLCTFYIKSASDGDYITLNTHLVANNKAPDNLLYPNGPVVMGMLDKSLDLREECFPISSLLSEKYKTINKYYLMAKIHSKFALFWLANEKDEYMDITDTEISDGYLTFLIENEGQKRSVCFEFSYRQSVDMDYVAYSLFIIEPKRLESVYDFYPPQYKNQMYRRLIPKGSYAVYHPNDLALSDKRINYNVYTRKGVVDTYVTECDEFPFCSYKVDELDSKDKLKVVNKMASYNKDLTRAYSALDHRKLVMVAYCKDDDNDKKGYCEVESSIFTSGSQITLVENEEYSKYVLEGERGSFKLDFKGGIELRRLSIDIMVHSGDVRFTVNTPSVPVDEDTDDFSSYKYYLSNKIYYHYNLARTAINDVTIDFQAEHNSYFTIKYDYNLFLNIQTRENVRSGESYLVEIDPTTREKSKVIFLENHRYKKEKPYLANFFALNCDFKVTREEKEISFFDGYAQEVILKDSPGYQSDFYEYSIEVVEADLSNYNHKMCMLYVAGYESADEDYKTEIAVGENINQQIIFNEDFNSIRFLYPHADPNKDLAVYINIIDQGIYHLKFYTNNNPEEIRTYVITRSQILYFPATEIKNYCDDDTLCNIIVEANFTGNLDYMPTPEPMIEITFRQLKNFPSYLQKSHAKLDFTSGDNFYYLYTEIGKNEIGEVSINFLRDFGNVWGKVVRKDQTTPEEEANWRGMYRMPSEEWEDSLPFNRYTKQFEMNIEDTRDCIEGCYLLLSIQVSQIGDYVNDSKFYPFSIIAKVTPNTQAYTDIPKVVIQVNEYIVGNVQISENERISQFYEVWLPHDSSAVHFDWQSKVAGLYINLGGTRPTTKNADFKLLPPGRDSILTLYKYQIIEKAKSRKVPIPDDNSLQDINLVIGVWTDKTDSVDTEIYSLRVHQPIENQQDDFDITEVNTDQKILCKPEYINDDQYRCLFMVTYDDEDVNLFMPLLIHASSVNQSAVTHFYGSFVERKIYDELDLKALKSQIPTSQSAQYNTMKSGVDYIYTKLVPGRIKYYFFVNAISNLDDEIMIVTSLPMYNVVSDSDYEFYPNPSSEQLLSVSSDKLRLRFFTRSSLIVNLVTLGGEAEIIWDNHPADVYNLRGKGDRLTLTSGSRINSIVISKRKTEGDKLKDDEDPGFVFYVSYNIRDGETNFDEIQYGQSLEIGYRDTHLPVYLYSKVGSSISDLNIAVTFKDSSIDLGGEYTSSPLIVRAGLAKESTVYKSKLSPELAPSFGKTIIGAYDPALKTAQVFLDEETVRSFRIREEDNPTLYISIEESTLVPSEKYEIFNIEAQMTKINSGVVPAEKNFNYGRYNGYFTNYYRLRIDKSKPLMMIELAFNSEYLDFSINEGILRENKTELIKNIKKGNGKVFIVIKNPENREFVYLNIFRKQRGRQQETINYLLLNYVFKYINVEKEEDFTDYKIYKGNSALEIKEEKSDVDNNVTITCTFNKLDIEKGKANITYFFKVVENSTHIYGEAYETIAVMESPYYTVYQRNPQDQDGKITLRAKGDLSNWCYLQVVAQIQQDTILDYVAYKGVKNIRKSPKGDSSDGNVTLFVIIMIILLALVVGLGIIVFIFQQRNKSLINQVKHVSFQQQNQNAGGPTADPDLLLKKSQPE